MPGICEAHINSTAWCRNQSTMWSVCSLTRWPLDWFRCLIAGETADLTLGLRPLGLSPGSQGSAACLIAIRCVLKFAARTPTAAAAEIAGARGPGVKSAGHIDTMGGANSK